MNVLACKHKYDDAITADSYKTTPAFAPKMLRGEGGGGGLQDAQPEFCTFHYKMNARSRGLVRTLRNYIALRRNLI